MFGSSPRPLGELELAVMEVLWQRAPLAVKEVVSALSQRKLAYTTLMTILDRLFKKGMVERIKRSHAFYYAPALDRDAYERRLVASMLSNLPTASREAMLTGFLDFASADDETFQALERLIAERKHEAP